MYTDVVWAFSVEQNVQIVAEALGRGTDTIGVTVTKDASNLRLFLSAAQVGRLIAALSVALREVDGAGPDDGLVAYRRPCSRCQTPVDQPISWDGQPVCKACLEVQTALASDDLIQEKEGA